MTNILIKGINNFLFSGKTGLDEESSRKYMLVNCVILFSTMALIILTTIHFFMGMLIVVAITSSMISISILLFIALRLSVNIKLVSLGLGILYLVFFTVIANLNLGHGVLLWFYTYPPGIIFLLGKRDGMICSLLGLIVFSYYSVSTPLTTPSHLFAFRIIYIYLIIVMFIYFFEDSRKKSMEKSNKLREQTFQASKMATLGEMSSGMAHEINNPLAIIHGTANNLYKHFVRKNGKISQEELKKTIDKITSTVDRIDKLVGGLRSFSKTTTNDTSLKDETISQIVKETVDLCMERIKSDQIDLQIGFIPENLSIKCNKSEISQVLMNLLSNSHYEVLKSNEKWIKIDVETQAEKKQIIISVSDSGTGVPENIRDQIFSPFFTTKEIGSGAGIGLGISKKIIEKHGGILCLDTNSPVTTFKIQLPMSDSNGES